MISYNDAQKRALADGEYCGTLMQSDLLKRSEEYPDDKVRLLFWCGFLGHTLGSACASMGGPAIDGAMGFIMQVAREMPKKDRP